MAVIQSFALVLEGFGFVSFTYDQALRDHPFKAIASSLVMMGIGVAVLLLLRFFMRVMWHDGWKAIVENEPPSWGEPPPLPKPSAPAPNPAKNP